MSLSKLLEGSLEASQRQLKEIGDGYKVPLRTRTLTLTLTLTINITLALTLTLTLALTPTRTLIVYKVPHLPLLYPYSHLHL